MDNAPAPVLEGPPNIESRPVVRIALLMSLAVTPALAHAILVDSTPAPNSHVPAGRLAITLRYNSRIDSERSKLTIQAGDGDQVRLDAQAGATPDLLVAATAVTPGPYTLRWQVLAKDGHVTRGSVPFTADKP